MNYVNFFWKRCPLWLTASVRLSKMIGKRNHNRGSSFSLHVVYVALSDIILGICIIRCAFQQVLIMLHQCCVSVSKQTEDKPKLL